VNYWGIQWPQDVNTDETCTDDCQPVPMLCHLCDGVCTVQHTSRPVYCTWASLYTGLTIWRQPVCSRTMPQLRRVSHSTEVWQCIGIYFEWYSLVSTDISCHNICLQMPKGFHRLVAWLKSMIICRDIIYLTACITAPFGPVHVMAVSIVRITDFPLCYVSGLICCI